MNIQSRLKQLSTVMLMLLSALFAGCSSDDEPNGVELIVASKRATVGEQSSLIVKQSGKDWTILYEDIAGFQYEEGYEYRLRVVVVTPPAESSKTASYKLVAQLSKEKKATIFQSVSYRITNNAKVTGESLTPDEIATIQTKIKQSSPFKGVTALKLGFVDFDFEGDIRSFTYTVNTEKTGDGAILRKDNATTIMFDFGGVEYEYTYNSGYMILDLTSKYKADYPNLELAQSGIGLNPIL